MKKKYEPQLEYAGRAFEDFIDKICLAITKFPKARSIEDALGKLAKKYKPS